MSLLKQFDITGKNIVITGAARGIGKGIIRVLAESGANILCTALTDVYLNKLVEELSMKDIKIEVKGTLLTEEEHKIRMGFMVKGLGLLEFTFTDREV